LGGKWVLRSQKKKKKKRDCILSIWVVVGFFLEKNFGYGDRLFFGLEFYGEIFFAFFLGISVVCPNLEKGGGWSQIFGSEELHFNFEFA
jgi:hypothetical protein